MLSCKQFTEHCSDEDEMANLSFWKRFQLNMHKFICHNCRLYSKLFKITSETAKKLPPEIVPDEIVEQTVQHLKNISGNSSTESK